VWPLVKFWLTFDRLKFGTLWDESIRKYGKTA
jgi:hypothetical protein